jgi:hypothetical protein
MIDANWVQAELHGVIPVTDGSFEPLQQNAIRWSNALRQAAAVCNGLTLVNKATVVGEEVEQKLFKMVEARFKARVPSESACCLRVRCLWISMYEHRANHDWQTTPVGRRCSPPALGLSKQGKTLMTVT